MCVRDNFDIPSSFYTNEKKVVKIKAVGFGQTLRENLYVVCTLKIKQVKFLDLDEWWMGRGLGGGRGGWVLSNIWPRCWKK